MSKRDEKKCLKVETLDKISGGNLEIPMGDYGLSNTKYHVDDLFHKTDNNYDYYIKIIGITANNLNANTLYSVKIIKIDSISKNIIKDTGSFFEYQLDWCSQIYELPSDINFD